MAFIDVEVMETFKQEVDGSLSDRLVVLGVGVGVDGAVEPSPLLGLAIFRISSAFLFFRGAILD